MSLKIQLGLSTSAFLLAFTVLGPWLPPAQAACPNRASANSTPLGQGWIIRPACKISADGYQISSLQRGV